MGVIQNLTQGRAALKQISIYKNNVEIIRKEVRGIIIMSESKEEILKEVDRIFKNILLIQTTKDSENIKKLRI